MTAPAVLSLADKLTLVREHWSPRIIAELNGQHVKLAKLQGTFVRHAHEHEDELFLVLSGVLTIEFMETRRVLRAGELVVIPRGTPHRPVCEEEVHVLLFEPVSTLNTGDVRDERTVQAEWI